MGSPNLPEHPLTPSMPSQPPPEPGARPFEWPMSHGGWLREVGAELLLWPPNRQCPWHNRKRGHKWSILQLPRMSSMLEAQPNPLKSQQAPAPAAFGGWTGEAGGSKFKSSWILAKTTGHNIPHRALNPGHHGKPGMLPNELCANLTYPLSTLGRHATAFFWSRCYIDAAQHLQCPLCKLETNRWVRNVRNETGVRVHTS